MFAVVKYYFTSIFAGPFHNRSPSVQVAEGLIKDEQNAKLIVEPSLEEFTGAIK